MSRLEISKTVYYNIIHPLSTVILQDAKDRRYVFEQEERERKESAGDGCDNTIEGSDSCHVGQSCGIWNFWCVFG